jgi:Flp pilus assembly protein TadD
MTEQGAKPNNFLIAGITLALVVAIIAWIYIDRMGDLEKGRQAEEATLLINQGIEQFQQKQYQQSLETLGGISEDVHQDWHINYYRGSSLIMLKDYEPAAVELEKALALNGEESVILYALGVVYYKLGNLSLSKAHFGKVLEVDPGNEDARGLMDIVANMERKQLTEPEATPSEDEAGTGH